MPPTTQPAPCTDPCSTHALDPCTAQLARQPKPKSRPSGTGTHQDYTILLLCLLLLNCFFDFWCPQNEKCQPPHLKIYLKKSLCSKCKNVKRIVNGNLYRRSKSHSQKNWWSKTNMWNTGYSQCYWQGSLFYVIHLWLAIDIPYHYYITCLTNYFIPLRAKLKGEF